VAKAANAKTGIASRTVVSFIESPPREAVESVLMTLPLRVNLGKIWEEVTDKSIAKRQAITHS
jgi:hypothetical protein